MNGKARNSDLDVTVFISVSGSESVFQKRIQIFLERLDPDVEDTHITGSAHLRKTAGE
jgi:hypothetical protein